VHDLTAIRYPQLCAPTSLLYPDLVRRAIRRGAWVHTPSQFVADEVIDLLGADPDKVRAVPHGVPSQVVPAHRSDDRYVVALGTAEPRKDFPGLVRAFDAVAADRPDVRLVITGPKGWGEDDLKAAITAAHNRPRISRLG